jgi:hypothetical protein
VTVHKSAETIQGGNYSREETIRGNTVYENFHIFHFQKRIVSLETIRRSTVSTIFKLAVQLRTSEASKKLKKPPQKVAYSLVKVS